MNDSEKGFCINKRHKTLLKDMKENQKRIEREKAKSSVWKNSYFSSLNVICMISNRISVEGGRNIRLYKNIQLAIRTPSDNSSNMRFVWSKQASIHPISTSPNWRMNKIVIKPHGENNSPD